MLCEKVSACEKVGGIEGKRKIDVLDPLQMELNELLSVQVDSAYTEGMKLGIRMMIELYDGV